MEILQRFKQENIHILCYKKPMLITELYKCGTNYSYTQYAMDT